MHWPQQLMSNLIKDCSIRCSINVQTRDVKTIYHRVEHEGLSFVTITLPNFLQDFMSCLENKKVDSNCFLGWKKQSCLPAFLQGFTKLVFCTTGELLNEPNVQAIHSIRQICSFFKKVKIQCTDTRIDKAFSDYICLDDSIPDTLSNLSDRNIEDFEQVSRILWSHVFGSDVILDELLPHHGPGSTAEKITGNKKYLASYSWPSRLNWAFSLGNTLYSSEECFNKSVVETPIVDLSNEVPVRVISVPKTLSKPRIIALEPVSMQMTQQAVKDYLVQKLESNPLTAGKINFSKQEINKNLALSNSKSGKMATLDLSAASDRVSVDLVSLMLSVNPTLRNLVLTTRSRNACIHFCNGSKQTIYLNKFASMGSALCFPIEAMFFATCIVIGFLKKNNSPITLSCIRTAMQDIYVYGDDIIVPVDLVEDVVTSLTLYGNKVGLNKSFWKGRFRESCGMDAYNGIEITPIYLRHVLPTSKKNAPGILSTVSTANQLYKKGFLATANYIKNCVESLTGELPVVTERSPGIGWHFGTEQNVKSRWSKKYHRQEVKTLVPYPVKKKDSIDGYSALSKCLLKMELPNRQYNHNYGYDRLHQREIFDVANSFDREHLEFSSRYGTLALKRRWTTR